MGCFVVAEFLLTSASRGPSAIAEPLVRTDIKNIFYKIFAKFSFQSLKMNSQLYRVIRTVNVKFEFAAPERDPSQFQMIAWLFISMVRLCCGGLISKTVRTFFLRFYIFKIIKHYFLRFLSC